MSGYKNIALNQTQAEQWKDTLSSHGIEIKLEDSLEQENENAKVKECPISITLGVREISAIEYIKKDTGERGIVFLHKEPEDVEFIDTIVSLLK